MMKIFQRVLIAIAIIIPFMVQAQDDSASCYDKPRFNSYIYVGGLYELTMSDAGPKYDIGAGCRINNYLYLGINIGGSIAIDGWTLGIGDDNKNLNGDFSMFEGGVKDFYWEMYTHISANAKLLLPIKNSRLTPFLDVKLGANIDLNKLSGFYMSYGMGIDYRRLSIMVGYEGISSYYYKIMPPNDKTLGHTIFLNVGVRIGR